MCLGQALMSQRVPQASLLEGVELPIYNIVGILSQHLAQRENNYVANKLNVLPEGALTEIVLPFVCLANCFFLIVLFPHKIPP